MKEVGEIFKKIVCVTGRHVRPLMLLQRDEASFMKQTRSVSLMMLRVSRSFPDSWKMDSREEAKEDTILFPSLLLAFVPTMESKLK
jgi:hypothetical protein